LTLILHNTLITTNYYSSIINLLPSFFLNLAELIIFISIEEFYFSLTKLPSIPNSIKTFSALFIPSLILVPLLRGFFPVLFGSFLQFMPSSVVSANVSFICEFCIVDAYIRRTSTHVNTCFRWNSWGPEIFPKRTVRATSERKTGLLEQSLHLTIMLRSS
jgi:hypothetical protein